MSDELKNTVHIYVSKAERGNGLVLSDNEGDGPSPGTITTEVKPGATVIWQLATNSGLHNLTGIERKSGSSNILSAGPTKDGARWRATVKSSGVADGTQESYSIKYKVTAGGNELIDDPILKMKIGSGAGNWLE